MMHYKNIFRIDTHRMKVILLLNAVIYLVTDPDRARPRKPMTIRSTDNAGDGRLEFRIAVKWRCIYENYCHEIKRFRYFRFDLQNKTSR